MVTYHFNILVKLPSYIIGNNGLVVVSIVYIYIGATTAKVVNLFKDENSELHKNEIYFMIASGIFIFIIICLVVRITNQKVKEYMNEDKPILKKDSSSLPSDFQRVSLS